MKQPPKHRKTQVGERHNPEDKYDKKDTVASRPRNKSAWRKCRKAYVMKHPVCQYPGCTEHRTIEVHHIIPINDRPDLAFDHNNLAALCVPHHAAAEKISTQKQLNMFDKE